MEFETLARDRDAVLGTLRPYLLMIEASIRNGWSDYSSQYADVAHLHSARTRASLVHDHVIDRIRRATDEAGLLRLARHRGLYLLVVEGLLVVRFKKLDRRLRASRAWTAQGMYKQEWMFADLPPVVKLQAGYQLDSTNSDLARVMLTCPDGNWVHWSVELEELSVTDLPSPEALASPVVQRNRVRIKPGAITKRSRANHGAG